MKKLWCMLLAALMLFAVIPASAAEGNVEISFYVGDETLTINGEAVTVEKPYVVGEGVTLVPLRVITEAFGATVEWIAETKSIVLTYPDVSILLQIDNPMAEVNGKAVKLLSAPELTPNGFTMVPLRFISENFGAEVSYDDATRKITVVKANGSFGNTVEGGITASYIGDSFYGWSMKNPTNMEMIDREFDGTYTEFTYDGYDGFYLSIKHTPEEYDFERDFSQWKSEFSGMTLMKADKNGTGAVKTMHFQVKDQSDMIDVRIFMTDKYGYLLTGVCDNANTERKNDMLSVLDSFTLAYTDGDIHDLSNAKDGMRTFTSDTMKFSIDVPAAYYESGAGSFQNQFHFYDPAEKVSNSYINVEIYSKSETGSAKELAEKDYASNKSKMNTTMATFQAVTSKSYANISGYEYTVRKDATVTKSLMRDVFFEVGDYVYNVTVATALPDTSAEQKLNAVLNSVKAETLSVEDTGLLLRDELDMEGTYTVKEGNWSFTVPNYYEEIASDATTAILQSRLSATALSLIVIPVSGSSFGDAKDAVKKQEESVKQNGATIVQKTTEKYMAGMRTATLTYSQEEDGGQIYYYTVYAGIKNGSVVVFTISWPELMYCANNIQEVETILSTFQMN